MWTITRWCGTDAIVFCVDASPSVREALQREAYGLNAERDQLLQQAVEADPEAALPHWYLGQVRTAEGKWQAVDAQSTSPHTAATRE